MRSPWRSAAVPYGYRVPEPGGAPEPDPVAAPLVREIFQRRAEGESYADIARWINELGQLTPRGRPFAWETIRDLCRQRFFLGVLVYKGEEHPAQHPAIISEDLWTRVQARRRSGERQRRPGRYAASLQGRAYCSHCGRTLHVDHSGAQRATYRERHRYECRTRGRSITAEKLDQQVGAVFGAIELPEDVREVVAQRAVATSEEPNRATLEGRRRRIVQAYLDEGITEHEYRQRLSSIDAQLRHVSAAPTVADLEQARELVSDLNAVWLEATPEERKYLIGPLVERVYVDLDARCVAAVVPTGAFEGLLTAAAERSAAPFAVAQLQKVAGLVETGENRTPRPASVRQGSTTGVADGKFSPVGLHRRGGLTGQSQ